MNEKEELEMRGWLYEWMKVLGRGFGQVMFQNHAGAGWLMWLGILCNSWPMALLALGGNVAGTLTARLARYDRESVDEGLYGFNGALVGIAVAVFLPLSWKAFGLMAVAAAGSSGIARWLGRQRVLPGLTAPFIVAVWLLWGGCMLWAPHWLLPAGGGAVTAPAGLGWGQAFGASVGQVMFQDSWLTGLVFLAAIFLHSKVGAGYAAWGSFFSWVLAVALGLEAETVCAGLMGYNGVLCAMALGDKTWQGFAWATWAVGLSVLCQWAGMQGDIPTLTAPFVGSVWITLLLRRGLCRKTAEGAGS